MKVLIIENEYSLADAISETLNKEGFSVKVETDGEKGEDEAISNILDLDNTDDMKFGDLVLDLKTGKMKANQNEIAINGKELELLESLLLNKNQIMGREILANKIWGYDSEAEYNNVEVYVSFLRKKLKILQSNVKIKAVRGLGYKLEVEIER